MCWLMRVELMPVPSNDLALSCEQPTDRREGGVGQLQRHVSQLRHRVGPPSPIEYTYTRESSQPTARLAPSGPNPDSGDTVRMNEFLDALVRRKSTSEPYCQQRLMPPICSRQDGDRETILAVATEGCDMIQNRRPRL